MARKSLENRVASLEMQLSELQAAQAFSRGPDWRRTIGMFADDEETLKAFHAAMKLREEDRKKARKSRPRKATA